MDWDLFRTLSEATAVPGTTPLPTGPLGNPRGRFDDGVVIPTPPVAGPRARPFGAARGHPAADRPHDAAARPGDRGLVSERRISTWLEIILPFAVFTTIWGSTWRMLDPWVVAMAALTAVFSSMACSTCLTDSPR